MFFHVNIFFQAVINAPFMHILNIFFRDGDKFMDLYRID